MAFDEESIGLGIAGGLIFLCRGDGGDRRRVVSAGQWRHVRATEREPAKWFILSGIAVCLLQMFRYVAFRLYFAWAMNREHEAFGGCVIAGTILTLLGVLAISMSSEVVLQWLPLPPRFAALAAWHWP